MKSKISLVLAAIVLVALLAAPAAARGASIKTIVPGDTIFVYETGLDLTALGFAGAAGDALNKYVDDDPLKALITEIPVTDFTSFDVLASQVGSDYGIYYAAPGGVAGANTVRIRAMTATLGLVLNASHVDSVDGKSVTRDTKIAFKVGSQYGSLYRDNVPVYHAKVDIEITTPGGAKVREFQDVVLSNFNLTSAEFYTDTGPLNTGLGNISLTGAEAGTYSALIKFNVTPFTNQAPNSNTVTWTVLSKPVTITTNKETVVRGGTFVLTITGESKHVYYVYLKSVSVGTGKTAPLATPGQTSVNSTTEAQTEIDGATTDFNAGTTSSPYGALVTTAADGTRTMEFNTTQTTDDKKYTVKVADKSDITKYDTVDVTVEKGTITATYEGTGTYYQGETIKLSGTNTDSDFVYLFMTGPNLAVNGVRIDDTYFATVTGNEATFKKVSVNTDDTWSFKWDTSALNKTLDSGTYTVYAVAEARNKADLSGITYTTASVVLKKPFVTAAASSNTLAKGDILYIRGTAEGKPTNVYVWIFGKNYRSCSNSASVKSDATYEYKLDRGDTEDLSAGQYFMVVQHPMMNGIQDIRSDAAGTTCTAFFNATTSTWGTYGSGGGIYVRITGLQAPDAATALTDALNSPNVDDTYTKLSVMIEEPFINIGAGAGCGDLGDKCVGDTFTITGTTNLAEGDEIQIDVVSSSFKPTEKTQSGEFSGASGTVTVVKGDTYNTFSFDVDASTFKPDEYIVKAEAIQPSVTATHTFNVLDCAATSPAACITIPVCTTVAPVTTIATTVPTTVPPTTAQPQPGFGAVIALIGIGAVALLVLRRH
ncbi:MAG: PGF-CTERM sorting domain-containing protein [Methanomicrobiales archaeon]|jgi:PGF-CTERM protein|nr:PGF-CTERM sorting domain-containing protein [Methanomicrobiales archaeon]